ncbi:MAG: MBOAT family O-acyltransferase [Candidatus Omnitrophota bacterium]
MVFNSFQFFLFFITLLSLYYWVSYQKQNLLLLTASVVFYAAFDYRFLSLLAISTTVDYTAGRLIHASTHISKKRFFLLMSLVINLGILCFFKYANFFASSAVDLLSVFGIHASKPFLTLILPLGISFYTFKTMSYTIDVYRGQIEPCKNYLDYALYTSFFPQLPAGPIERAGSLIPQITHPRTITKDKIIQGLWLILWGLFKKLVIADNLAVYVNSIFDASRPVTGVEIILATVAFAFQLYGDFSGYTDISRGIARLLGFETILNFNLPYLSINPVEFWKRWHISLSTWLRDYLFLPIAYAVMRHIKKPFLHLKVENWGYIIGISITMLLGGLWHGANWTFVLWGGYQGLLLAGHHVLTRGKKRRKRKGHALKITLKTMGMFLLTCLGWLFFRAANLRQVGYFLRQLVVNFKLPTAVDGSIYPILFYIPLLWIFELWIKNSDDPRTSPGWVYGLGPIAVSLLILALITLSVTGGQGFIYAQF